MNHTVSKDVLLNILQREYVRRPCYVSLYCTRVKKITVAFLRMLLSSGLQVGELIMRGHTLTMLHIACGRCDVPIARMLLDEAFADVNAVTSDMMFGSRTPVDCFMLYLQSLQNDAIPAARQCIDEMAELLLRHCARSHRTSRDWEMYAISQSALSVPLVKLLAHAGYRFNRLDRLIRFTPEYIDCLIRNGVAVNTSMFIGTHPRASDPDIQQTFTLLWYAGVSVHRLSGFQHNNQAVPPLRALCIALIGRERIGRSFLPRMLFLWPNWRLIHLLDDPWLVRPWTMR